ncbi:MAG: glycoside hydrolase family 2 [Clostridiales bacterium]|jgi:beta-galactosidase/beta-glucuronidase|nr:glycoside hydrolase family 2 [Clostridiales bacterium]
MKHTQCYLKDYPRPQLVRKNWLNLNGRWDFAFDGGNKGEYDGFQRGFEPQYGINVPFAYQTQKSGVNIQKRCDVVWYKREFTAVKPSRGKRLILHFEGCDYLTKVWINGQLAGEHTGAYERFSFDISSHVKKGANTVTVRAEDSYSCRRPRGKQRWCDESFDCWYVDTTGIWKTVWIEEVSAAHVERFYAVPKIENSSVYFEGEIAGFYEGLSLKTVITYDGAFVAESTVRLSDGVFRNTLDISGNADKFKLRCWSHHTPSLYDVEMLLLDGASEIDRIGSYFGVVSYEFNTNCLNQNDSPFYLKMLLDQGYWSDSGLTPPDEDAIVRDILLTKEAGFNGIRKHQKIEDERFYYYCDILGAVAWCEMPSMYEFSQGSKRVFTEEVTAVIEQHRNHPSIMAWVLFNESWGIPRVHADVEQQRFADAMYALAKALDPARAAISNDGWDHTTSDLITLHNYAETGDRLESDLKNLDDVLANKAVAHPSARHRHAFADGYRYEGQPVILSEYAGIAFSRDKGRGWGYGKTVENEEEFLKRLAGLTEVVRAVPEICGYCVTQTTDVEQEVNGLLTADRKWKASVEAIKLINK